MKKRMITAELGVYTCDTWYVNAKWIFVSTPRLNTWDTQNTWYVNAKWIFVSTPRLNTWTLKTPGICQS